MPTWPHSKPTLPQLHHQTIIPIIPKPQPIDETLNCEARRLFALPYANGQKFEIFVQMSRYAAADLADPPNQNYLVRLSCYLLSYLISIAFQVMSNHSVSLKPKERRNVKMELQIKVIAKLSD